jgi:hypothetical protein
MPIQLPNLDDRTYDDLMQEALSLLPSYDADWTNYNPSDPGITLIELFAYMTEMMIYRSDQVTSKNKQAFLALLTGKPASQFIDTDLNEAIRETVVRLRQPDRAVTVSDFERLALQADPTVQRVHCLPRRNLLAENPLLPEDSPGSVSLIILPRTTDSLPIPSEVLLQKVKSYLDPRRLLTTQVYVVKPRYFAFRLQISLRLKPDAEESQVRSQAIASLTQFFHPLRGGEAGIGWPFGRDIYVSEVYELLDRVAGVDYVQPKTQGDNPLEELLPMNPLDAPRRRLNTPGQLVSLALDASELANLQLLEGDLEIVRSPRQSLSDLSRGGN